MMSAYSKLPNELAKKSLHFVWVVAVIALLGFIGSFSAYIIRSWGSTEHDEKHLEAVFRPWWIALASTAGGGFALYYLLMILSTP